MKREILFRGFNNKHKEWRYGYYFVNRDQHFIVEDKIETNPILSEEDFAVNPETIGQYTGLKDKNGKKIFEGDIVEFTNLDLPNMVIRFDNGSFMFCEDENSTYEELRMTYTVEVVENIYDTPELMKQNNEKEDNP